MATAAPPQSHGSPVSSPSSGSHSPSPSARKHRSGPCAKKVTFADSRGLALAMCKEYDTEEEPIALTLHQLSTGSNMPTPRKFLTPLFPQPALKGPIFHHNLTKQGILLENIVTRAPSIAGTVLVRNLCFNKHVFVRFTCDNWQTFTDVPCTYACSQHGGQFDRFSFTLTVPNTLTPGQNVKLALCFRKEDGGELWDNNGGKDYEITCLASQVYLQRVFAECSQREEDPFAPSPLLHALVRSSSTPVHSSPLKPCIRSTAAGSSPVPVIA